MPELPDVQNVVDRIRGQLTGRQVEAVVVTDPKVLANATREALDETLSEETMSRVRRRGKFIVIEFEHGYALLVHLRMTGDLKVIGAGEVLRYTRFFMDLSDGKRLVFTDYRRFGRIYLVSLQDIDALPPISELGPEPLETSLGEFQDRLKSRKGQIKALLLDQRFIVGIGNLYADEMLWRAGIAPARSAARLSEGEIKRLHQAMQESLSTGHGIFFPYRTSGECVECATPLVRSTVGGRTTYHCPRCQG